MMIVAQFPMTECLKHWQALRLLTPLDRHFALELLSIEQTKNDKEIEHVDVFLLICALVSQQLSNQHSCLRLTDINLANPLNEELSSGVHTEALTTCRLTINHQQLIDVVSQFSAVGTQGENTPLILDGDRLYLSKYYYFESQVASIFRKLAAQKQPCSSVELAPLMHALFPFEPGLNGQINWQKVATSVALSQSLAVITGGPGTGKTTTVTKLLTLLLAQQALTNHSEPHNFTIRLVAPTGKAAARLSESIKASKSRLKTSLIEQDNSANQAILTALAKVPEEAATLHRLLGVIPNSHEFRHHKDNPLRLDLLVVDEASMVDLPMMYKLLSALSDNARLILLGDQDQLASVEAGAVLADICAGLYQPQIINSPWQMRYSQAQADMILALSQEDVSAYVVNPSAENQSDFVFSDSLCMLMHSHRFKGDAGIGLLANAVNYSNIGAIRQVWQQGYQELYWFDHTPNSSAQQGFASVINQGKQDLLDLSVKAYQPYLELIKQNQSGTHSHEALAIINQYNQYRILCAMRAGEFGVDGINQSVTESLTKAKLIDPKQEFYLGRPVIIQNNDYNIGLFNGDIGLILQDEQNPNRLLAHFIKADGSLLKVLPARLPQHDTCYAMTVHKSQGSEFDTVSFVLPQKPSSAQWNLLTKELVYTAITRAKNRFYCLGSQYVFERAAKQITKRASGLAARLWG